MGACAPFALPPPTEAVRQRSEDVGPTAQCRGVTRQLLPRGPKGKGRHRYWIRFLTQIGLFLSGT